MVGLESDGRYHCDSQDGWVRDEDCSVHVVSVDVGLEGDGVVCYVEAL